MAVNHKHFGTFCEICFHGLTPERCAVDANGIRWDVCAGECAREAGLTYASPMSLPAEDDDEIHEIRAERTITIEEEL